MSLNNQFRTSRSSSRSSTLSEEEENEKGLYKAERKLRQGLEGGKSAAVIKDLNRSYEKAKLRQRADAPVSSAPVGQGRMSDPGVDAIKSAGMQAASRELSTNAAKGATDATMQATKTPGYTGNAGVQAADAALKFNEASKGNANGNTNAGNAAVSGAATGALAGSAAGPWGAVIGGAVGAVTGILSASSNKKAAKTKARSDALKNIAAIEERKGARLAQIQENQATGIRSSLSGFGAALGNTPGSQFNF